MSKTYKRFFIIEEQHQPLIDEYFKLKATSNALADKFIADHGVKDIYAHGSNVSYITFTKDPDMTIWKKAGDGFMPRAKHKSLCQELKDIRVPSPRKMIITPIFGNPMRMILMGTPRNTGRIPMYSAQFYGSNGTYFIELPWSDLKQKNKGHYLNQPIPDGLTEVKEWEVLKILDENKALA